MSNHSLPPPGSRNDQQKPPTVPLWVVMLALGMMLTVLLRPMLEAGTETESVSYTDFLAQVADDKVTSVRLSGTSITATLRAEDADPTQQTGAAQKPPTKLHTYAPEIGDPELLDQLRAHDVDIQNDPPSQGSWIAWLAPWLMIMLFYFWFWSRLKGGGMGGLGGPFGSAKDFLKGSAGETDDSKSRVTFDDVAGQENAKREVAELIDFLKDPERFQKLGAEAPRGVLLMGPPGTGKTLMARALAGEAGAPFFSTSASEFIEMFVGVGASRVRAMFAEAKKRAPSIIFIDELDSIGRARGAGLGGGNDEREQTLNQILAEMDGFSGHEAVVVLAATNRPDVLDPALLRPGRFDRHVTLNLPTREDRLAILKVHVRDKPLASDVDLGVIAAGTPGFSGADLKNLVNEAAIGAARASDTEIAMRHFDEARDKVMMGTTRTLAITPDERHRLAVHESGHTAVAHYLPKADNLYKVTIIPRGQALGVTHMLPTEERHTMPEDRLRDQLAVLLAGRASERVFLGTVSSGADDDIKRATALARSMAGRWGMAESIGPVDLRESEDHPFLGREVAQPRHFADRTAAELDEAVRALLLEAENRAVDTLEAHRPQVTTLIDHLEREETLDHDAIEDCLGVRETTGA